MSFVIFSLLEWKVDPGSPSSCRGDFRPLASRRLWSFSFFPPSRPRLNVPRITWSVSRAPERDCVRGITPFKPLRKIRVLIRAYSTRAIGGESENYISSRRRNRLTVALSLAFIFFPPIICLLYSLQLPLSWMAAATSFPRVHIDSAWGENRKCGIGNATRATTRSKPQRCGSNPISISNWFLLIPPTGFLAEREITKSIKWLTKSN